MSISALDKNTVKLISTTQVVTTVSSAVKELIENALDADAKSIEINLTDHGATLIEVKDDGCGISRIDAPYMALSSYTSKIFNFSDLESLETYGFRGEALYSLSAVSDLTIITKTEQDEAAMSYVIDHSGCIATSEPCHRANGTTVQVRQLFKQMPVRRQLITNPKKANQDVKVLEAFVKCYGICKFPIRISYKVDGNIIFAKPGMGSLEEAATYILGKKVTSNMTWISFKDAEISMKLMVPLKQNVCNVFLSGAQYIFVNNRPIKHKDLEKILTKAILEGSGQDSSSRKKPVFLLYILTNASNIDVNLDPNKTCIFFKEQQLLLDTVDKCVKDFYGIQREMQTENICDKSLNEYQDCTQEIVNDVNVEKEWPACKKRKLEDEKVEKTIEQDVCVLQERSDRVHADSNKEGQIERNERIDRDRGDDKCEQNLKDLNVRLPSLNLSESDSNDSHNFTLVHDADKSRNLTNADADDSPPFELSQSQTLSQLPVVDLGEDFDWDDSSMTLNKDTSEKENMEQNVNAQKERRSDKMSTLDQWSRGQVPGLKGGTDIHPYVKTKSNESPRSDLCSTNVCSGFRKFSTQHRHQVAEQNPTMTAPQIAQIIANRWKKLSPEERGYYRDMARDEKMEQSPRRRETTEKKELDGKKCRNRILKALEKMKTANPDKKENLLVRTIVPWDMDLEKVTKSFHNNTACEDKNLVIGQLSPNLWIVHRSAHIWILDSLRLKKELNVSDTDRTQESKENVEELLNQWFSLKDDLSLLHPIHSLAQN